MLTIKELRHIESAKRERRLPDSLVQFLEKTFRELHEAYESETEIALFSLEMYGPIYVLEKGVDNLVDPSKVGLCPEKNTIMGYRPEWVERINLIDFRYWRIGLMPDNDYLLQVIIPADVFGQNVDRWLREYLEDDELLTRPYMMSNDKAD